MSVRNSKQMIRKKTLELLRQTGSLKPAINPEKIAKFLGANVIKEPFESEISGMIFFVNQEPFIAVNKHHSVQRQRFTIAHECGHLCLHRFAFSKHLHVDRKYLLRSEKSSQGTDNLEIEANQFAAELLMPEHMIIDTIGRRAIDLENDHLVSELADLFRVSLQAMSYRLANIFGQI
jgi:Zn-dependent peptidase ImmA (M78 family)